MCFWEVFLSGMGLQGQVKSHAGVHLPVVSFSAYEPAWRSPSILLTYLASVGACWVLSTNQENMDELRAEYVRLRQKGLAQKLENKKENN